MKYRIVGPDGVVEASFSSSPYDVATATIRIEATVIAPPEPVAVGGSSDGVVWPVSQLRHVEFSLPTELCTDPGAVTPQVERPQDWRIEHRGGGVFRAIPSISGEPAVDTSWLFVLRNVPVAPGPGRTEIEVVEFGSTDPDADATVGSPIESLAIRKQEPALRIDTFRPINALGEVTPVVDSGDGIWLEWATTGATDVSLIGPEGAITLVSADRIDPIGSPLPLRTTGTYTLVADGRETQVVAQVTVTVRDQTVVEKLIVDGEVVEDLMARGTTVDGLAARPGGRAVTVTADLVVHGRLTVDHLRSSTGAPEPNPTPIMVDADLTVANELRAGRLSGPTAPDTNDDLATNDPTIDDTELPDAALASPPTVGFLGSLTVDAQIVADDLDVGELTGPLLISYGLERWGWAEAQATLTIGSWTLAPGRSLYLHRRVGTTIGRSYEFRPGTDRDEPGFHYRSRP